MANPILSAMRRSNITQNLGQVKQMLQTIRTAQNPQAAFQMMIRQNPFYSQAQQLVAQAGGDANKAFRDLAQQNGLDPEEILRDLM